MPRDRVAALIDGYIASYREKAGRIEACRAARTAAGASIDPGRWLVSGFGVAIYRAAADYLTGNREALLSGLEPVREAERAEERRVGKECVCTGGTRGSPDQS